MITITVGLKEIQNKGPDLNEDSCSDLVNHIGKEMEQIGRLDDSQKTDVLMRAQRGGFIRWHILSAGQTIISTTHRNGCVDVFPASVTLEDRSRVMPVVLDETQLRKFIRDLRSDLEQLQKLKRSQVADIWRGLENAGFVECSQVQEATQDNL